MCINGITRSFGLTLWVSHVRIDGSASTKSNDQASSSRPTEWKLSE
jgi:hypothetical protein